MTHVAYRKNTFRLASTRTLVEQANVILRAAADDGWHSMTLRQLYYQFVSKGFIPNATAEYKRLGRVVTDARYCGLISWTAIEDAGRSSYGFPENSTAEGVLRNISSRLIVDPWLDQDVYVEVWIEKQALEATVQRPCAILRVPYMACKGYLSASEAWRAGARFRAAAGRGKNLVLLHLGDHDPSGIDMTRDNGARLQEFLQGNDMAVDVRRIALNMDQIGRYGPPPNPAKEDDSRFKGYREQYGDSSWELDALSQNTIGELLTASVDEMVDDVRWQQSLDEQSVRRVPLELLDSNWKDVADFVRRVDSPLLRLDAYDRIMDGYDVGLGRTAEFLTWITRRLVNVHGEDENADFVTLLRRRTEALERARNGKF